MDTRGEGSKMAQVLEAKGLKKTFGDIHAVRDVSFSIAPGETYGLLGPNGAGKTTLLRVLAGLHPLSQGSIEWAGGGKARVGYVPQAGRPDPVCPVTVEEFLQLAFVGDGPKLGSRDCGERVAAAAGRTGCSSLLGRRFAALSGGETQRVYLAYALLREAELLLLDEPQTGLDAASSEALASLVSSIASEGDGRCVVVVSHDLHFVARVATRVLCLRGHVCSVGPVGEMLALHVGGAEIR